MNKQQEARKNLTFMLEDLSRLYGDQLIYVKGSDTYGRQDKLTTVSQAHVFMRADSAVALRDKASAWIEGHHNGYGTATAKAIAREAALRDIIRAELEAEMLIQLTPAAQANSKAARL